MAGDRETSLIIQRKGKNSVGRPKNYVRETSSDLFQMGCWRSKSGRQNTSGKGEKGKVPWGDNKRKGQS